MRTVVCMIVLLILLTTGGLAAVPPDPAPRTPASPVRPWISDERGAKPLALRVGGQNVLTLVTRAGKEMGLRHFDAGQGRPPVDAAPDTLLVFQSHLRSLRLFGGLHDAPVSDVLDGSAVGVGGLWRREQEMWVLTERAELARLAVSGTRSLRQMIESVKQVTSLSPKQQLAIRRRGWLSINDLSPRQMRALEEYAKVKYLSGSQVGPDPQLLSQAHLKLVLTPIENKDGTQPESVTIFAPGLDGEMYRGGGYRLGPANPAAPPGYYNRPAPPQPPFLWKFPTPSEQGEPTNLSVDGRLRLRLPLRIAPASDAAERVAQAAKVNLIASTRLDYSQVRMKAPTSSALEVLQQVALVTGGRWRRVGGIIVLQPHPALEKIAQFSPKVRETWADTAVATVQRGLTGDRRKRLRERGRLTASDLTATQANALKWLAAVRFITKAGEDPAALDLKRTRLEWQRASGEDVKRGITGRVRYLFPTINGELREAAVAVLR